uniref:ArfGAP with RhoGAP domain, ankyrin repeat and PH domain 1 n=2 Tax=Tetraodon nigroviridis TaxID=99883 RepID=H3CGP4_TETNG
IYQKRWVKLDAVYLKYFDNDKVRRDAPTYANTLPSSIQYVLWQQLQYIVCSMVVCSQSVKLISRNQFKTGLFDMQMQPLLQFLSSVSPMAPSNREDLTGGGTHWLSAFVSSKYNHRVTTTKLSFSFLLQDYRIGVGITSIEMNVANVRKTDRRSFEVITPYRLFSFIAESEQLCKQWVDAMQNAIHVALSNCVVAEQIWAEPSNSFCADCGIPKPEWAAINLCVVICNQCAGEHRGLGPSISKVRSLKMDRKVWTEELVKVFLCIGNERANSFWAANVPPSEALSPSSCREERHHFISNKYHQGKYRKYHPLFGNQKELNNALCINVQCSDLLETLSLIFCGADVNCSTGMATWYSPMSLAIAHSQPLQAELMSHNLNTESPRSEVAITMSGVHYSSLPSVSLNGFLFKTGSMTRVITDRKGKEEFSRRWCTLNDGVFSYYESDRNSTPNGALKASEIICLAVDAPKKHGYHHTFEVYSERLYLFGTDDPESHKEWINSIAKKSFLPATAEPLLKLSFERIGRLKYKGLNLQTSKFGWFALVGSTLHAYLSDSPQGEEIQLRKLNELCIYIFCVHTISSVIANTAYLVKGSTKQSVCSAIQCIFGIFTRLLEKMFQVEQKSNSIFFGNNRNNCEPYIILLTNKKCKKCSQRERHLPSYTGSAYCVILLCEEYHTISQSTLLLGFLRSEGSMSSMLADKQWSEYSLLKTQQHRIFRTDSCTCSLMNKAPILAGNHELSQHICIHIFLHTNKLNYITLAKSWLFINTGENIFSAIQQDVLVLVAFLQVDEVQLKKQLEEIRLINHLRNDLKFPRAERGGDFICTVYLEEKSDRAAQTVKISGSMTAAELSCQVLDLRNIFLHENDYWSCWEVNEKEEIERPLHYQERVLPFSCETESHLLIKKHIDMGAMINYLEHKVLVSKSGTMKYKEERNIIISTGFSRYFILDSRCLKMFKDVRKDRAEQEWEVKCLKIYMGIKKKLRPPTPWGMTVVCEKTERQQW